MLAFGVMNLMFLALVLLAGVVVLVMVLRTIARLARLSHSIDRDSRAALTSLRPGARWLRAEMTVGERANPPGATGAGALVLFADELCFVRPAGAPLRLPLSAITDVQEVRAVGALGATEHILDAHPDYAIKVSSDHGDAIFAVENATAWIAALARARP